MPSVVENQVRWTAHPWEREGHEWSPGQTAAGGEMLWWRALLPRISTHLPAVSILEIGPGFGRWTQHLLHHCDRLTAVDVTERCVEHCRGKFSAHPGFTAWTNDGSSLDMVADGSVDFAFSFDSLVHAEGPVLRSYLLELGRKLKPGGSGFIHHSNLAALTGGSGRLPAWLTRTNWRGDSMSARLFREYCGEAGLSCRVQEVINWISRSRRADRHRVTPDGLPLTDVLSTFERPIAAPTGTRMAPGHSPIGTSVQAPAPTVVYLNPRFAEEWRQIIVLSTIYGRAPARHQPAQVAGSGSQDHAPVSLIRAMQAVTRIGASGIAQRIRHRSAQATDELASFLHDHVAAWRVRQSEPVMNAARRRRCPDCRLPLTSDRLCRSCNVRFVF